MDVRINFSTQGVKSLDHRIGVCLILLELPKSLFSGVVPFYTLCQQCFRVLVASHPLQNLVFSVVFTSAVVVGV